MKSTQNLERILINLMCKSHANRNDDYYLYADYLSVVIPDVKPSDYKIVSKEPEKYGVHSFNTIKTIRRNLQATARIILNDEQLKEIGGGMQ